MQAKYALSLLIGIAIVVVLAVYGTQAGLFQGSVQGLSGKAGGVTTNVKELKGVKIYTQKNWPFTCTEKDCSTSVWPTSEIDAIGKAVFYVDGKRVAEFSQKFPRSYTEGMKGLSLILKRGEVSDGTHTLRVEVTSGGQTSVKERTFEVSSDGSIKI